MVLKRSAGGVVAQVWSKSVAHRGGTVCSPLVLEEERMPLVGCPQFEVGVRVDGSDGAVVAEIARGPMWRVELGKRCAIRGRLLGQVGDEPMHRLGVLQVTEQLTRAGAADVAPTQWMVWLNRRDAPALFGDAHGGAIAAGDVRDAGVAERQSRTAASVLATDEVGRCQAAENLARSALTAVEQVGEMGRAQPGPVADQVKRSPLSDC